MTPWEPAIGEAAPVYLALADALERDVAAGRLASGARLPTHRALARRLGVTVGTVTRAYAEAGRRGLVAGEVGRGTYVRPARRSERVEGPELPLVERALGSAPGLVDLAVNLPPEPGDGPGEAFAKTLAAMAADPASVELLRYQPHVGMPRARAAGAAWIAASGVEVEAERVLVTAGSQHGLAVALAALAQPGETVLTEALTYPGVHAAAQLRGLELRGLALDGEGMVPEALEAAARRGTARLVYLVPTLQNPTVGTMSAARRERIVEVARRHDLLLLEDDIHGRLPESAPPPLAALAPERTVHLANLSKSVAGGLRVGFLTAPAATLERLAAAIGATMWMASPLAAEVAARWIEDGTAETLLAARRRETVARQAIAARVLAGLDVVAHPAAHHLWLRLPAGRRPEEVALAARERGVAIAPASAFAVPPEAPPRAVRLTVGAPRDRAELERALALVRDLVAGPVGGGVGLL